MSDSDDSEHGYSLFRQGSSSKPSSPAAKGKAGRSARAGSSSSKATSVESDDTKSRAKKDVAKAPTSATKAAKAGLNKWKSGGAVQQELGRNLQVVGPSDAEMQSFKYSSYKGKQKEIVSAAVAGKDVFVLAPTGMGKSLCFQIPAIAANASTHSHSPLQILTVEALRDKGVSVASLCSATDKKEKTETEKDLASSNPETRILYVTPERLKMKEFLCLLDNLQENGKLNRLVVDERDIIRNLGLSRKNLYIALHPFNRANLYYEVRYLSDPSDLFKMDDIHNWIMRIYHRRGRTCSGIIYCRNRKGCDAGLWRGAYHAGIKTPTLNSTLDKWMNGGVDVVVATIAFGMGIDKSDVRYVIHYDLPKSFEGYYQETGRAGRDGVVAKCVLYFSREDCIDVKKWVMMPKDRPFKGECEGPPPTQRASDSLAALFKMAENPKLCRHVAVCRYFGEVIDEKDEDVMKTLCNQMCDVCKTPDRTVRHHAKLNPIDTSALLETKPRAPTITNLERQNALISRTLSSVAPNANGSRLGMAQRVGVGIKRTGSLTGGDPEASKRVKVGLDLAPALVTRPYTSVGGLKKPFKAPTFVQPGGGGTAAVSSPGARASVASPIPAARVARPRRPPSPPPVVERSPSPLAEVVDAPPSPPQAKRRKEGKSSSVVQTSDDVPIEIDDDGEEEAVSPPTRRRSEPEAPIEINDDSDEDGIAFVEPKRAVVRPYDEDDEEEVEEEPRTDLSSMTLEPMWSMDDQKAGSDDDDDVEDVVLLHEHSTKVTERKRRKGVKTIRKALHTIFISNTSCNRLWRKLPKAPTSKDRRKRVLLYAAVAIEGSALVHSSTGEGYGYAIGAAEEAISGELKKVDLWNSGKSEFEEAQDVVDVLVKECARS
ncbi:P-loop containing nucleoside triphosphate hydrolase protein [Ephemerocybe angulata]|uniref:DNA 3'-5' helicase n=1 Tax=Ephemerocybe angulata TaxID=980116 RepID=A0A8H6LY84_9AGAR|nr:P-loop containing nucleoside triphosphate hydrolase protein [Tulosesus angulatus]